MSDRGVCCKCSICCTFTLCFTVLNLWLSFRVTSPACSIEDFYAFHLNKSHISTPTPPHNNHTLSYHLMLRNRNKDEAVYYDTLNLTFYYTPNKSFTIGNSSFAPFIQGQQLTTHRYGSIEPRGIAWESVSNISQNGSIPVFTVELATAVRYKNVFWKTKRHRLVVKADLKVNDLGTLVKGKKNKGIKLRVSDGGPTMIKGIMGILGSLSLSVFIFTHFC